MAQIIDKRTFSGGMNDDVDKHLLPQNTYSYALNLRNSPSGNVGIVTNVKGNELVTYTLPDGGNKVIGAKEFVSGSKMFYLVWNSNDDHTLLMYDYENNIISTVFKHSILEFDSDTFITSIDIVLFKSNTIIYWADPNGEPKKISIESGIRTFDPIDGIYKGLWTIGAGNFIAGDVLSYQFGNDFHNRTFYYRATADTSNTPFTSDQFLGNKYPTPNDDWEFAESGYVYGDPLTEYMITQLVEPPTKAPTVQYEDNETLGSNRVRSNMWQFKYRYVYSDGQESAWSPISKVPLPSSGINPTDLDRVDWFQDNQIRLGIPVSNNGMIRSVKLASRIVPDSKAAFDFLLYNELFLTDLNLSWESVENESGFYDVFTNREDKLPINKTDSDQLFYWVPKKSTVQTLTGDNRLLLANGVWGYDIDKNILKNNSPSIGSYTGDDVANTNTTIPSGITPTIPSANLNDYPLSFDIGYISQTINPGDVIRISLGGNTIVREIGGNFFPGGFPNDKDGIRKFTFSHKYVVQKADENLTQAALKIKISDDLAIYGELLANEIKSWYYRNTFGKEKESDKSAYTIKFYSDPNDAVVLVGVLSMKEYTAGTDYETATTIEDMNVEFIQGIAHSDRDYKKGSTQTFGFVYSDDLGRVSTVVTNSGAVKEIDWYSGLSPIGNGLTSLSININHQAPEWATRCHIVKKIDNGVTNFIQMPLSIGILNEVTTLNNTNYFVVGLINELDGTVDKDFGASSNLDLCNIYLNAFNGSGEAAYNTVVKNSILSYSFTKGDRLRFISNADKTVYYEDDVEILGYNDTYNYITINRDHLEGSDGDGVAYRLRTLLHSTNQTNDDLGGALFEIYTPQNEEDLKGFFYETGITLDIENRNHVPVNGTTQDYSNGDPAIVELDCGDSYYKSRWYSIKDTTEIDGIQFILEDYNYNDAFNSRAHNVGRFNVSFELESKETSDNRSGLSLESYKPITIFNSESYIQGTDINRLGTVYDISFKDADASFNSVQHIHSDGDKLFIFHEDRVGLAHNSRYVATSLGNKETISSGATSPVISDIQYYTYRGGISLNPESFAYNKATKYWVDIRRGAVLRLAQNGIDEIQLKGVDRYIKGVSKLMISDVEKDIALGVYDKRNQEYVINLKWSELFKVNPRIVGNTTNYDLVFETENDISLTQYTIGAYVSLCPNDSGKFECPEFEIIAVGDEYITVAAPNGLDPDPNYYLAAYNTSVIAYSDRVGGWVTFYSYKPDFLSVAGIDIVSWSGANLHLHESNTANRCEFYGVDYDMKVEVVSNQDPTNVKRFLDISVKDNSNYDIANDVSTTEDGIVTELGQVSDLQESDFSFREGSIYAPFFRDKNSVNVDIPLLDGDYLKGRYIAVRLKIAGATTRVKEILAVEIKSAYSFLVR